MLSREFASSFAEADANSWKSPADDRAKPRLNNNACLDDIEVIEHDAAHGVFRSPRPSFTMSEFHRQQTRAKLLSEGPKKEDEEDDVCTKVWRRHSSHTILNSDKDRFHSLDLIVDDNNPWEPTVCQMGQYKQIAKWNGHTVYSPVFGSDSDSAEEQNIWDEDAAERRQQEHSEKGSDKSESEDEDEDEDSGFEMLDYPALEYSIIMSMN